MTSYADTHSRIRARYGRPGSPIDSDAPILTDARATALDDGVVIEVAGRTLLTAPVRPFSLEEIPSEAAETWQRRTDAAPHMKWVAGRYVEAEQANRNGALWSAGDLQFGALGVRGGPLNWLHEADKVIGTLAEAEMVLPSTEAAATERPYIATLAALWPWVRPNEVAHFVEQAQAGKAYQSMECIAEAVECGSCGSQFPYAQTVQKPSTICAHIRERSATRRFINPSFLGAGTIVAPVSPGWANAHVTLMPTAQRLAEAASEGAPQDMSTSDFERLVAAVLAAV